MHGGLFAQSNLACPKESGGVCLHHFEGGSIARCQQVCAYISVCARVCIFVLNVSACMAYYIGVCLHNPV